MLDKFTFFQRNCVFYRNTVTNLQIDQFRRHNIYADRDIYDPPQQNQGKIWPFLPE